jgi:hypothetical protein
MFIRNTVYESVLEIRAMLSLYSVLVTFKHVVSIV